MDENEIVDHGQDVDDLQNVEVVEESADQEDHQEYEVADESEPEFVTFDDNGEQVEEVAETEPEPEEEQVKPEHKPKKKHVSLKTKFNEVQREKFRALNEIEQLRKENERLQRLALQADEAATFHNEKAIALKLEQAKAAKAAAYDNADTEGMIKADEMFTEAMHQKAENDRWKKQQEFYKNQRQQIQEPQQQYVQEETPASLNEETESWLANNQWFNPNSRDYNESLADLVHTYSQALEKKYVLTGNQDKIMSQEYFDEIDRYISDQFDDYEEQEHYSPAPQIRKAATKVTAQPARMNINMKPVRQNVAPVGKTIKQAAPTNSNRVVLTAKEIEFAKTMNISPQEYAKQKAQIAKSGKYSYEQFRR